jgi:hypothetical protein
VPTMIAAGVASPSAHGQSLTRTATTPTKIASPPIPLTTCCGTSRRRSLQRSDEPAVMWSTRRCTGGLAVCAPAVRASYFPDVWLEVWVGREIMPEGRDHSEWTNIGVG